MSGTNCHVNRAMVSAPAVLLWLVTVGGVGAAAPVAALDGYEVASGSALVVTTEAGVLANDTTLGREVEVVVVDEPVSGTLTMAPGGGFRYDPAPGMSGQVTFTYKLRTVVGPVLFAIDPVQSRLQVEARATTEYGAATGRDDSRVAGSLRAVLAPASAPFALARIVDLQARLIDSLDLRLGFGCVFGLCLASVNVQTRVTEADGMRLELREPGAAAAVLNGVFSQFSNTFALSGTADITGTGAAAGLIPSGPQSLDTTAVIDLTDTQIADVGGTLTLRAPVVYSGQFFLDPEVTTTNFVNLTARSQFSGSSGYLVATAPASSNRPEESNLSTVTISITPPDPDQDGDGIRDDWERAHGLDPEDASDALLDEDGDGHNARAEFHAGTDPRLAGSVLAISALSRQAGTLLVQVSGLDPERSYQMEVSEDMTSWGAASDPFRPESSTQEISVSGAMESQYFRLRCLFTWP